jgi:transposase
MACPDCADKDRRIAALEARIAALEEQIAALQERLGKNSTNSSKPPSTDPPAVDRPRREPSGRKPGGQPGHPKHDRRLLPADREIPVRPERCERCGERLHGDDPNPERRQVVEIPPIRPEVTDYLLHARDCGHCGARTRAGLPPGVPVRGYGPRITGMVGLFTGTYRLSKRLVQSLLLDVFGVEISLGSISNLEQELSASVQAPVEEACASVPKASAANVDETGWYEGRANGRAARAWLWVAVTATVTVFKIAKSRGKEIAKNLLGNFQGRVGSDRWSAYNWLKTRNRQLCWSHLLRDFQGFVDRKDAGAPFGELLLIQAKQMFCWWHRVRDGTLSRSTFQRYMASVRREIFLAPRPGRGVFSGQNRGHGQRDSQAQGGALHLRRCRRYRAHK